MTSERGSSWSGSWIENAELCQPWGCFVITIGVALVAKRTRLPPNAAALRAKRAAPGETVRVTMAATQHVVDRSPTPEHRAGKPEDGEAPPKG